MSRRSERNGKGIVDFSTGEIEGAGSDLYIGSHAQDKAYRELMLNRKERSSQPFTASEMSNLHEVYDVLTTTQCGYLLRLQCNVGYEGGILLTGNHKPMTTSHMMDELGLKRKRQTFYDFLSACVDNGIIIEIENGENGVVYAVNQRYHFKGAFAGKNVVKTYIETFKEAYKEVKAADLGLLYRMIPFIHYETNALCANPFEKDISKVRLFNGKELAEAIGIHPDTLTKRLARAKFGGRSIVARTQGVGVPVRYYVNHRLFYRRDKAPNANLRMLFLDDET